MSRMNKESYRKLIEEDLAWIEGQPRTLEREHIIMILQKAVEYEYGAPPTVAQQQPVRDTTLAVPSTEIKPVDGYCEKCKKANPGINCFPCDEF